MAGRDRPRFRYRCRCRYVLLECDTRSRGGLDCSQAGPKERSKVIAQPAWARVAVAAHNDHQLGRWHARPGGIVWVGVWGS